jgi:uncharacterized membrane protein
MNWLSYALLTVLFYSVFDLFVKLSSQKVNDGLAAFIFNFVSTLVLILYLAWQMSHGNKIFEWKPNGLLFASVGGIAIGLASIFFIKMFATGTNLSVGVPVVRIGMVILGSLLGVLILKEGINLKYILGFLISIAGLYLLITSKY